MSPGMSDIPSIPSPTIKKVSMSGSSSFGSPKSGINIPGGKKKDSVEIDPQPLEFSLPIGSLVDPISQFYIIV
eukprot:UN00173